MTAKEIVDEIRDLVSSSICNQRELYELLASEGESWKMYLEELREEDE